MRLIDYFDRGADLYPERHCLHDGTRGWTYAEVRGQTHRVANGLLALGLGRSRRALRSRGYRIVMRGLGGLLLVYALLFLYQGGQLLATLPG